MRLALTALLVGSLLALAPASAEAAPTSSASKRDPDDTEGRLDLRRVALASPGHRISGTLTTDQRFRRTDLDGANSLRVDFKVNARRYRSVHVWYLSGELTGTVCTYRTADSNRGEDCDQVGVRRAGDRTVRFTLPRSSISRARALHWRGHSVAWSHSAGCGQAPSCDDYVGSGSHGFLTWRP